MCPISKHIISPGGADYVALKFIVERIGVSWSNTYNPQCFADIKLLIIYRSWRFNKHSFFSKNVGDKWATKNVILEWYDIIAKFLWYINHLKNIIIIGELFHRSLYRTSISSIFVIAKFPSILLFKIWCQSLEMW